MPRDTNHLKFKTPFTLIEADGKDAISAARWPMYLHVAFLSLTVLLTCGMIAGPFPRWIIAILQLLP